jgi:hypothetical protein
MKTHASSRKSKTSSRKAKTAEAEAKKARQQFLMEFADFMVMLIGN